MTSTSATGIVEKNIVAAFNLLSQIIDDPGILDTIPEGANIVFIPRDDPDAPAENIQLGITVVQKGEDVYFRHVETLDTPEQVASTRLLRAYGEMFPSCDDDPL